MLSMKEIVRGLYEGHVPAKALNGKPPRYSASTVKQVDAEHGGCERKHYFEQVIGIGVPVGPALADGTKTHTAIEKYLKTGEPIPVGPNATQHERWAATGLKHLPLPGTPGMVIEEQFTMGTWPGGPEFTGTADLYVAPPLWTPELDPDDDAWAEVAESYVDLYDHKTTSGYARGAPKGWVLTDATLPDDIQNISYGRRLLIRMNPVKGVRSKWVYYDKSGAPSTAVSCTMERAEVLEKWSGRVLPLVSTMHRQHVERPTLAQVPMNEKACGNFGGCPHRSYCVDYKGAVNKTASVSAGLAERIMQQHTANVGRVEKEKGEMGRLSEQLKGGSTPTKEERDEVIDKRLKAGTLVKSKAAEDANEDEAPALNPPNPFTESNGAKLAKAKPLAARSLAKTEAPQIEEEAATFEEKHKAKAAATGGFNLYIGCDILKGSKRDTVHVFELLAPVLAEVRAKYKGDWNEAVKYGEDIKKAKALLGDQLDGSPELLAGKNVRAPARGLESEVAMTVLAPRAMSLILASAV